MISMHVLVTGHNGYIGSVMVPFLQAAGHQIVGLDTFYFEECTLTTDLNENKKEIKVLRKDVRDVTPSPLQGIDAVIHLAALCNDPLGDLNQGWTYDINHLASVK